MAQPTVTARPATWAGTSAPILYKFTSTNYGNAGYYMAVEVWNSTTAAKIADAKYYANSSGAVTVDVSAFLKSAMSLDNTADLTTSDVVYTDGNWVKYYIKYQEVWTASSETQVNDSGNPRWAIYGGLQIGSTNDLSDYSDFTSLISFLGFSENGIVNNYILLSVISAFEGITLRYERFLNGASLSTVDVSGIGDITPKLIKIKETGTADTIVVDTFSLMTFAVDGVGITGYYTQLIYIGSGSPGTAWTLGAYPYSNPNGSTVTLTTGATSQYVVLGGINAAAQVEHSLTLEWDATGTVATKTYTVYVSFLDSSDQEIASDSYNTTVLGSNITDSHTFSITPPEFGAKIAVRVKVDAFGSGAFSIRMHEFSAPVAVNITETKTINILEDCQNIVMLAWRNSLGGWECYPFTYTQEYTWDYGGGKKAKRLTLFANNLTLNQWEAIQGLNTLGDMYRVNITEMTTSLNRTSATIGQSVYVLNSDGTKVGVNVIGQSNTTNTKQKRHSAIVTIEYPELFLQ